MIPALIITSILSIVLLILYLTQINKIKNSVDKFNREKVLFKPLKAKIKLPVLTPLIKMINKNLLELQAYRAFQLDHLINERNKFELLLDTIEDGILLLDNECRIISYNRNSQDFLKIENPDIYGKFWNFIKDEKIKDYIKYAIEQEKPYIAEMQIESKTFKVTIKKYFLASINDYGVAIIIRDITAEKEIEKMKDNFIQMITHDLKNPLFAVSGNIEILELSLKENQELYNKFKDKFSNIKIAIHRLYGLIEDIINVTKLRENRLTLNLSETDINQVVNNIIELMTPVAEKKGIKIKNTTNKKLVAVVDEKLIERVIENLVSNAIKYTNSNTEIRINFEEDENYVTLCVEDEGEGIPEDKIPLIFEKYGQLDKHKNMGYGIGLNMCKMVVELHKGKIWVDSKVGKGSKFCFSVSKNIKD